MRHEYSTHNLKSVKEDQMHSYGMHLDTHMLC